MELKVEYHFNRQIVGDKVPGRTDPLEKTTVCIVFREWDHPEGLDRVCLEMGLGGGISKPDDVPLRRTLNKLDFIW